jgi:tight adherence protein C
VSALETAMTAAWALAAVLFAACLVSVARDVVYVTLADGRRQARDVPTAFKLLLPFAGHLDAWLARPAFAAAVARSEALLVSAGFEGVLSGREFVALKILSPLTLGAAWCAAVAPLGAPGVPLGALGATLAFYYPVAWLNHAVRRRHLSIMRALPFVLDVLTLSVEAGMDFMGALQRNCATRRMDPLNEELLRMTKEIQVGLPRREALRRMAARVGQPDLRLLARALVQADELGVSIGSILRIQSDQLRARRFERAEKLANEAPTKMLAPLMFFIFPAVFLILLGPVLTQAVKGVL